MGYGIGDWLLCKKAGHGRYKQETCCVEVGISYKIVDIAWDSYECGEPFYVLDVVGGLFHIRCEVVDNYFVAGADSVERYDGAMGVILKKKL